MFRMLCLLVALLLLAGCGPSGGGSAEIRSLAVAPEQPLPGTSAQLTMVVNDPFTRPLELTDPPQVRFEVSAGSVSEARRTGGSGRTATWTADWAVPAATTATVKAIYFEAEEVTRTVLIGP
jgi:hypothetical protein